ncbi:GL14613 [Drosophila persimilis]|uniref:GL14613 n=1 Tax=Drosophila persimilis TaxID=7234 RepID=B4GVS2_DROPE|nr:GL14613 [Drosophila persimilis]
MITAMTLFDWDILQMLLVGNQFVSFGWLQAMIHKMLENAMSCFTANPSVRMSAIRTQALVNKLNPKYLKRIAQAKKQQETDSVSDPNSGFGSKSPLSVLVSSGLCLL